MVERPGGADRLALAAKRRPRRQVPGEQTALAQRAHGARVPARQGAALGLDIAEPAPGCACANAHATAGELAV